MLKLVTGQKQRTLQASKKNIIAKNGANKAIPTDKGTAFENRANEKFPNKKKMSYPVYHFTYCSLHDRTDNTIFKDYLVY